jgi:hypothetical protein
MNMDQPLSTLELARAVSDHITEELDKTDDTFVLVHREFANLAVAFVDAAIESLENEERKPN